MCIDIVEVGIANGQITIFDRVICLPYSSGGVLSFRVFIYIIISKVANAADFDITLLFIV